MERIKRYLLEDNFKMIIDDQSLFIANYKRLLSIEENYLSILSKEKKINVYGKKLHLKKILKNELLIMGMIEKIEVIHDR